MGELDIQLDEIALRSCNRYVLPLDPVEGPRSAASVDSNRKQHTRLYFVDHPSWDGSNDVADASLGPRVAANFAGLGAGRHIPIEHHVADVARNQPPHVGFERETFPLQVLREREEVHIWDRVDVEFGPARFVGEVLEGPLL